MEGIGCFFFDKNAWNAGPANQDTRNQARKATADDDNSFQEFLSCYENLKMKIFAMVPKSGAGSNLVQ